MSEQTEKTSSHKTEKVVNKKTADGMDITENSVVTAVDDVTDNEPTKQKKRTGKKNIPEIKNDAAEVTQEPFNENEAKPVDNEAPEGKSVKIAARKLPSKKALAAKKTTEVPENEPEDRLLHEADFVASDTDMEEEHEEQLQTDFTELSREELVSKLEELVQSNEISKIKARVAGIKVVYLRRTKAEKQAAMDKYLADGGNKEDYIQPADTLEERFKNAFDIYKEKKVHDDARQERAKLENLEQKKQILEEIKQLISSEESLKKTYDEFKILQEKWKQIGQVPRNEIESLWNNYHYLVDKFFEKVKIGKELKDLDLKKNLEQKILLCEKVEELLFEKSITKSFKLLQKYHDEWKEIGPIPQDKKDEIWERFKTVSDKINQARREYYSKLQSEQEANLLAKTALCEKMEAINAGEIATGNDWKAKTAEVLEMQELWDSIGRTPAKFNDEIWERFRSAVNLFYNNKNEFFSQLKEQQITNYNLKLGLCVQAEAVVNNSNWKQSTAEILNLQQEWKKIGPAPKRYSEKVWKRFRAACDDFFKRKSEYFSNIQSNEQENLKKKEALLERMLSFEFSDNKNENFEALKNFQREWVTIGYVPMDVKEILQEKYRQTINQLMDKLKISSVEMSTLHYKTRIESLQGDPDAGRMLSKERFQLETKISAIKNEINLWENNIGFLANSKNAQVLKTEFESKINKAKQEVALLEAKLKLLKGMKNK